MTDISDPVIATLALLTGGCAVFVLICGVADVVEYYLQRRQARRSKI